MYNEAFAMNNTGVTKYYSAACPEWLGSLSDNNVAGNLSGEPNDYHWSDSTELVKNPV